MNNKELSNAPDESRCVVSDRVNRSSKAILTFLTVAQIQTAALPPPNPPANPLHDVSRIAQGGGGAREGESSPNDLQMENKNAGLRFFPETICLPVLSLS